MDPCGNCIAWEDCLDWDSLVNVKRGKNVWYGICGKCTAWEELWADGLEEWDFLCWMLAWIHLLKRKSSCSGLIELERRKSVAFGLCFAGSSRNFNRGSFERWDVFIAKA